MHRDIDAGTYSDAGIHRKIFGPTLVEMITRHTKRTRNVEASAERGFELMLESDMPTRSSRG